MFSFDASEERIEVLKAEAALAIVAALRTRLEAVNAGDSLRKTLLMSKDRAKENKVAYDVLLTQRNFEHETGQITGDVLSQANALYAAAERDNSIAQLSYSTLSSSIDDMITLLPLQEKFSQMALEVAVRDFNALQISAPSDGKLRTWQVEDGWVSRGAILATYEDD